MPKLTIDGQELDVPAGENLLLAARRIGVEVPFFCYHEKLSIAANCRMCLVEIEKNPKLQPACQQTCADGMVVKTSSPRVLEARAAVMEFLLVNHPLDCPICDKAGECMLQDNYMAHDAQNARTIETKVHKPRLEVLGPLVNYNAERCIMCTRCVRFMDEIPKSPQLGVFNRGDRNVIGVFPGKPLDDPYSLNVVELCPVGALGNLDFRFNSRVWTLDKINSVCDGCAKGCNVETHAKNGEVYRMVPRRNDEVNSTWMCDEGRLSYHAHGEGRATEPLLGGKKAADKDAVAAARMVVGQAAADRGNGWTLALSPALTNEDAFAWLAFVKQHAPLARVMLSGRQAGSGDTLLRRADKNPNRKGVQAIADGLGVALSVWSGAQATGKIIVAGTELPDGSLDAAVTRASHSLVVGTHLNAVATAAKVLLLSGTVFELHGSFVNEDSRVQRVRAAHGVKFNGRAHWEWVMELGKELAGSARWQNADGVFADLAAKVAGFSGLRLQGLGLGGKLLGGGQPQKAVAAAAVGGAA